MRGSATRWRDARGGAVAVALAGAALAACTGGGARDRCLGRTPPAALIDPSALVCTTFPPDACDPACGACPPGAPPLPAWAPCSSPCDGLAEPACLANADCQAAYDASCLLIVANLCNSRAPYLGCHALGAAATATGACRDLGVEPCWTRPDCATAYTPACDNGVDDDHDGAVDEQSECALPSAWAVCVDAPHP